MNGRTLIKMAAAIAALAALFMLLKLTTRRGEAERKLIPLKESEIARIEISKGDQSCVLGRRPEGWRLERPVSYEADKNMVEEFTGRLVRSRLSDALSASAANHPVFELDAANAVKTALYAGKTARPAAVFYAGKEGSAGLEGVYVRLDGGDSVYEADGLYRQDFSRSCSEWLDKKMLSLAHAEISKISARHKSGGFEIEKSSAGWKWAKTGRAIPKNREDGIIAPMLGSLSSLEADSVIVPAAGADLKNRDLTVSVGLSSGETVEIAAFATKEKDKFSLTASNRKDALFTVPDWKLSSFRKTEKDLR